MSLDTLFNHKDNHVRHDHGDGNITYSFDAEQDFEMHDGTVLHGRYKYRGTMLDHWSFVDVSQHVDLDGGDMFCDHNEHHVAFRRPSRELREIVQQHDRHTVLTTPLHHVCVGMALAHIVDGHYVDGDGVLHLATHRAPLHEIFHTLVVDVDVSGAILNAEHTDHGSSKAHEQHDRSTRNCKLRPEPGGRPLRDRSSGKAQKQPRRFATAEESGTDGTFTELDAAAAAMRADAAFRQANRTSDSLRNLSDVAADAYRAFSSSAPTGTPVPPPPSLDADELSFGFDRLLTMLNSTVPGYYCALTIGGTLFLATNTTPVRLIKYDLGSLQVTGVFVTSGAFASSAPFATSAGSCVSDGSSVYLALTSPQLSLLRISVSTLALLGTYTGTAEHEKPNSLLTNGTHVLVTANNGKVRVLSGDLSHAIATFDVQTPGYELVCALDAASLFCATVNASSFFFALDLWTGSLRNVVLSNLDLSLSAHGLPPILTVDDDHLYVAHRSPLVTKIRKLDLAVVAQLLPSPLQNGTSVRAMSLSNDTSCLIALSDSGWAYKVATSNLTVVARLSPSGTSSGTPTAAAALPYTFVAAFSGRQLGAAFSFFGQLQAPSPTAIPLDSATPVPTIPSPSTPAPTTGAPTTTTEAPTTAVPTTAAPTTTEAPTTSTETTTTAAPTTSTETTSTEAPTTSTELPSSPSAGLLQQSAQSKRPLRRLARALYDSGYVGSSSTSASSGSFAIPFVGVLKCPDCIKNLVGFNSKQGFYATANAKIFYAMYVTSGYTFRLAFNFYWAVCSFPCWIWTCYYWCIQGSVDHILFYVYTEKCADVTFGISGEVGYRTLLGRIPLPPLAFFLGPIPVYSENDIEPQLVASAEVGIALPAFTLSATIRLKVGAQFFGGRFFPIGEISGIEWGTVPYHAREMVRHSLEVVGGIDWYITGNVYNFVFLAPTLRTRLSGVLVFPYIVGTPYGYELWGLGGTIDFTIDVGVTIGIRVWNIFTNDYLNLGQAFMPIVTCFKYPLCSGYISPPFAVSNSLGYRHALASRRFVELSETNTTATFVIMSPVNSGHTWSVGFSCPNGYDAFNITLTVYLIDSAVTYYSVTLRKISSLLSSGAVLPVNPVDGARMTYVSTEGFWLQHSEWPALGMTYNASSVDLDSIGALAGLGLTGSTFDTTLPGAEFPLNVSWLALSYDVTTLSVMTVSNPLLCRAELTTTASSIALEPTMTTTNLPSPAFAVVTSERFVHREQGALIAWVVLIVVLPAIFAALVRWLPSQSAAERNVTTTMVLDYANLIASVLVFIVSFALLLSGWGETYTTYKAVVVRPDTSTAFMTWKFSWRRIDVWTCAQGTPSCYPRCTDACTLATYHAWSDAPWPFCPDTAATDAMCSSFRFPWDAVLYAVLACLCWALSMVLLVTRARKQRHEHSGHWAGRYDCVTLFSLSFSMFLLFCYRRILNASENLFALSFQYAANAVKPYEQASLSTVTTRCWTAMLVFGFALPCFHVVTVGTFAALRAIRAAKQGNSYLGAAVVPPTHGDAPKFAAVHEMR